MSATPFLRLPFAIGGSGPMIDESKVRSLFAGAAEFDATAHWLFGTDHPAFDDLLTGRALTPFAAAPQLGANKATFADGYSPLVSDISVSRGMTICAVWQHVADANYRMVFGHWDQDDILFNLWQDSAGYVGQIVDANGAVQNWRPAGYAGPAVGTWLFGALSLSDSDSFLKLGSGAAAYAGAAVKAVSGKHLYVGPAHNAATGNPPIAEVIVFPRALTTSQVEGVHNRSIQRLALRGITLS